MAFSDTSSEVRDRVQTVTRRPGWRFLKAGDLVVAVERRPHAPAASVSATAAAPAAAAARELAVLRVRGVRVEPLARLAKEATYAEDELPREGLPCWSRDHFIAAFLRRHRLKNADVEITRIEFEYVEHAEPVEKA